MPGADASGTGLTCLRSRSPPSSPGPPPHRTLWMIEWHLFLCESVIVFVIKVNTTLASIALKTLPNIRNSFLFVFVSAGSCLSPLLEATATRELTCLMHKMAERLPVSFRCRSDRPRLSARTHRPLPSPPEKSSMADAGTFLLSDEKSCVRKSFSQSTSLLNS